MPRAPFRWAAVALLALAVPAAAAPRDATPRLDPRQVSPLASHIRRVEPAVVGIRVDVPRDRPSAATLGVERWGSGVIFDANQGYLLTVSYVLLDASRIEVSLRDGRKVPARLGNRHPNLAPWKAWRRTGSSSNRSPSRTSTRPTSNTSIPRTASTPKV